MVINVISVNSWTLKTCFLTLFTSQWVYRQWQPNSHVQTYLPPTPCLVSGSHPLLKKPGLLEKLLIAAWDGENTERLSNLSGHRWKQSAKHTERQTPVPANKGDCCFHIKYSWAAPRLPQLLPWRHSTQSRANPHSSNPHHLLTQVKSYHPAALTPPLAKPHHLPWQVDSLAAASKLSCTNGCDSGSECGVHTPHPTHMRESIL